LQAFFVDYLKDPRFHRWPQTVALSINSCQSKSFIILVRIRIPLSIKAKGVLSPPYSLCNPESSTVHRLQCAHAHMCEYEPDKPCQTSYLDISLDHQSTIPSHPLIPKFFNTFMLTLGDPSIISQGNKIFWVIGSFFKIKLQWSLRWPGVSSTSISVVEDYYPISSST